MPEDDRTKRSQGCTAEARLAGRQPVPSPDEHGLPQPSIWPVVMAAGMTLFMAGLATNVVVLISGAALFALSAWGWVRDMVESFESRVPPPESHAPGRESRVPGHETRDPGLTKGERDG